MSRLLGLAPSETKRFTIVGIHKGGVNTVINGKSIASNVGRLITPELIDTFIIETKRMKADMFIIW
jgi:hypothetical protein